MAEMLLINPRKRRRKAAKSRRKTARRRNPIVRVMPKSPTGRVRRVRLNPLSRAKRRSSRRRRNPIGGNMLRGIVPMIQNAAIGAVGSVGVDFAWGKLNPMLPPGLQTNAVSIGAGDAIKMVTTVALGQLLSRFTRGYSRTAAQGALIVQADRIVRSFLPADIKSQLAWYSPAPVVNAQTRVGPYQTRALSALTPTGSNTPLLSAFTRPGMSPVLSRMRRIGQ